MGTFLLVSCFCSDLFGRKTMRWRLAGTPFAGEFCGPSLPVVPANCGRCFRSGSMVQARMNSFVPRQSVTTKRFELFCFWSACVTCAVAAQIGGIRSNTDELDYLVSHRGKLSLIENQWLHFHISFSNVLDVSRGYGWRPIGRSMLSRGRLLDCAVAPG